MRKKVYVSAIVKYGITGAITPLSFAMEDGQAYQIDKVLALHRVSSASTGNTRWKYLCLVQNTEMDLYFDVANQRWLVDVT